MPAPPGSQTRPFAHAGILPVRAHQPPERNALLTNLQMVRMKFRNACTPQKPHAKFCRPLYEKVVQYPALQAVGPPRNSCAHGRLVVGESNTRERKCRARKIDSKAVQCFYCFRQQTFAARLVNRWLAKIEDCSLKTLKSCCNGCCDSGWPCTHHDHIRLHPSCFPRPSPAQALPSQKHQLGAKP